MTNDQRPKIARGCGSGVLFIAGACALALTTRATVAQVYTVPTTLVEPEIPQDAKVLVFKLSRSFAMGDIFAYRDATESATGDLVAEFNGVSAYTVEPDAVIGRVVLTTR